MWSASAQGNHRTRITSVMESQYVAFHISRKPTGSYNHVVKETERSASGCHGHGSRVGWAVWAICMFSVGVNVVLLMMYIGLQREVERQKGVVDNINTFLTSQDARGSSRQDQVGARPELVDKKTVVEVHSKISTLIVSKKFGNCIYICNMYLQWLEVIRGCSLFTQQYYKKNCTISICTKLKFFLALWAVAHVYFAMHCHDVKLEIHYFLTVAADKIV